MGLLEPITHKKEIEDLLTEAQEKYDSSMRKFEDQKKQTTKSLEHLGRVKIQSWARGMDAYVDAFESFNNIELDRNKTLSTNFIGKNETPAQMVMNIQNASMTAGEVAKAGVAALGTGALVGIASYGGAMMFGKASTGAAIAALHGAAKTNATLAWFGGGSLKAGGLGMAAGKLVLAGVVVAPILAVAAIITSAKSKEKLAEAKKINAEAKQAVEQIDTMTTGMEAVAKMSDNYTKFIKKFDKKFQPFIKELNKIKNTYDTHDGTQIDFDLLTPVEQKTFHLSWLMAQVYYHILSVPILTDNGEVSTEAGEVLTASLNDVKQIKKDTFQLSGEDAPVGDLVWKPAANNMIIINFALMALLVLMGCGAMANSILSGIVFLMGSVISFPIFIKFRNLPQSKQYMWRIIRASGAVFFVLAVHLML